MEIASDVRELLVGLKEPNTVAEQQVFEEIQDKHQEFCDFMHKFLARVADLALALSPEARVFFYQLQRSIYQDWTSTITECAFFSSPSSPATLACKLARYESVADQCMGSPSEELSQCSCKLIETNSNPSLEQCLKLYEQHLHHAH
ncbi:hypothetical protein ACHHYP_09185 [Achlya hypogyna]|uniref:Uncharacterized protein n=1 Tax=Achlya hypogyna TaxID=1202772 RepID=A0A1V9ZJC6_ACHHY|nr:hypothetical protein ACHHYP_09185 [Achlya hypogyna]